MNSSAREILEAPFPIQPRPTTWIYKVEAPEEEDMFVTEFQDYQSIHEAEEAARDYRSRTPYDIHLWGVSNKGTWIQLALIRKDHQGRIWTDITPSGTRFL